MFESSVYAAELLAAIAELLADDLPGRPGVAGRLVPNVLPGPLSLLRSPVSQLGTFQGLDGKVASQCLKPVTPARNVHRPPRQARQHSRCMRDEARSTESSRPTPGRHGASVLATIAPQYGPAARRAGHPSPTAPSAPKSETAK